MYPGLFGLALVHSGAHMGRRDHSGSLGFTQCALGLQGLLRFAWVHLGVTMSPLGHSCSRGITPVRLVVGRFIRV